MNRVISFVKRRATVVAGIATALLVASPVAALADTTTTASYDISGLGSGITSSVQNDLTFILPIAAGLLALGIGWALVRKMFKAR